MTGMLAGGYYMRSMAAWWIMVIMSAAAVPAFGTGDPSEMTDKCSAPLKQRLEDCQYHFRSSQLPEDKRKNLTARDIFSIHKICDDPNLRSRFTMDEQLWIASLSKQAEKAGREVTTAERYEIDAAIKYFYGSCDIPSGSSSAQMGPSQLDVLLKGIWRGMAEALGKDDLDKACSYFLEPYQEMRKKQYAAFTPEARRKISNDLLSSQLAVERVEDGRAIYHLITVRDGQRYSFQLVFMKNIYGEWKIYNF